MNPRDEVICQLCRKPLTPDNAKIHPEFFICDTCVKPILADETLTREHLMAVCQPGRGREKCCRYLMMGGGGWQCAKLDTNFRFVIDERSAAGTMRAKGDNCEGKRNPLVLAEGENLL